jgi:hypothetical protein
VLSGAKSLFGAVSQPEAAAQQRGRPGIFGLEEFQRQVQVGALGQGNELPKIEDNTGKTEENTGKTNELLKDVIDGLAGAFGLA